MTDSETKSFREGYEKACKEILEDLAKVHELHPERFEMRRFVDLIWERIKYRLRQSKSGAVNCDK